MKQEFDAVFDTDIIQTDELDVSLSSRTDYIDADLDIFDDRFLTESGASVYLTQYYKDLAGLPSIEGVILEGDKTFEQLNFRIDRIDCGTSTEVI